jgi:hypothetical protein
MFSKTKFVIHSGEVSIYNIPNQSVNFAYNSYYFDLKIKKIIKFIINKQKMHTIIQKVHICIDFILVKL